MYVDLSTVQDFVGPQPKPVSDGTMTLLIESAEEMIDGYCGQHFPNPTSLVKTVCCELVRAMLVDSSKKSESTDDYSYSANEKAFAQILGRLSYLKKTDTSTILSGGKDVEVMLL